MEYKVIENIVKLLNELKTVPKDNMNIHFIENNLIEKGDAYLHIHSDDLKEIKKYME